MDQDLSVVGLLTHGLDEPTAEDSTTEELPPVSTGDRGLDRQRALSSSLFHVADKPMAVYYGFHYIIIIVYLLSHMEHMIEGKLHGYVMLSQAR
jgi:hypothetical protein